MKIVVAIPCGEQYKESFERAAAKRAELLFVPSPAQGEAMLKEADVIIGNPSLRVIKSASRLKWLQTVSAGVEYYTQNPDFPRDVVLTNMTGAFGCIIAEYILAGILAMYRNLFAYKSMQARQLWQDAGSEMQLMGRQVLILGAGDIGEETAKRLKAFGTHVTGIRRVVRSVPEVFDRMETLAGLDELLPQADIVIGCLPHTPETVHILDERRIRLMKKGALLVNVGRGSLVVTQALVDALRDGHLAGAVLDVTEAEPLPKGHPLWSMEQVLLTPHISGRGFGHAPEVEKKIIAICCDNLRRYLAGETLRNLVDFESGYANYSGRGAKG